MIENIAIKRIGFLNKKQREYTEYKLVQQAQNGCDESFEKLINSYKEYLYKTAFLYVKNEHDALDIYQETVYKAYINIQKLRNTKFFKTWIIKILINKCNDVIRANKKIIYIEQEKEEGYSENIEQSVSLRECFDRLKPDYKIVMIMYYDQGFNSKEISEILNINESTVRTRMARGRDYLREHYLKMDREA